MLCIVPEPAESISRRLSHLSAMMVMTTTDASTSVVKNCFYIAVETSTAI
jgi:hypothetical protein